MVTAGDFRNGITFEMDGNVYQIVEFQHVKPGKGPAFVRTKLRNIKTGRVRDNTFSSGTKVNVARVERRPYQYLYRDEIGYYFMHLETFEQIHVQEELIDAHEFLKEGENVEVVYHADTDTVLSVEVPQFVVVEVTYTEPGLRGDTATNTFKQATIETGSTIMVPLFINTGDRIRIYTSSRTYIERAKS